MTTPRKSTQRPPPPKSAQRRTSNGRQTSGTVKTSLRTVAVTAAKELAELIGRAPEGIVGVEKQEDGWCVRVEVVESHRIPETTDILAVYEVDVDDAGTVLSYRRTDRYVRGRIQD
ncbi:gas vesicle protein [Kribbella sp. NPDC059898]|uniref:gas vesicle protein GvpO n=1 Tax=Kribbella sp. NPDC059898 TaxID=3346995 RepID=UPI003658FCA2